MQTSGKSVKVHGHAGVRKGETVPQTPESLQVIMAADAEIMLAQDKKIKQLEAKLLQKQAAVTKWRGRYYTLKGAAKQEVARLKGG